MLAGDGCAASRNTRLRTAAWRATASMPAGSIRLFSIASGMAAVVSFHEPVASTASAAVRRARSSVPY